MLLKVLLMERLADSYELLCRLKKSREKLS